MTVRSKRTVASVLVGLLNGVWYLMAAALVIAVCLAVAGWPLTVQIDADGGPNIVVGAAPLMAIPVTFALDPAALPVSAPTLGVETAVIQDAHGVLRFPPPQGASVAVVVVVLMIALVMWVVAQLRALCRTMRDGDVFATANVVRIRRIAFAVVAGEIARSAMIFAANHYAMTHFAADGIVFNARPHLNPFALVDGLILLALAEVFRAGRRLEDDQALTV